MPYVMDSQTISSFAVQANVLRLQYSTAGCCRAGSCSFQRINCTSHINYNISSHDSSQQSIAKHGCKHVPVTNTTLVHSSVQENQFGLHLCCTEVVTYGVKLTEVRVLHAEVGTVSCHLASLLLQVCQLLAVVLHLQQHEGRVS